MEDLSKELDNIPQTIEEYLVHTIMVNNMITNYIVKIKLQFN